ncbi:MAG: DUF4388 domain-containing protein [Myxococcota bacterium]
MSIALRGNLRDFGMSEVFQLIGQQRKTGVLEIAGADQRIQLRFDAGSIVDAVPVGAHEDWALGDLLLRVGWITRDRLADLVRQRRENLQSLSTLLVEHGDLTSEQVGEIRDLLTQESLFSVLRWQEGSFHFLAQPVEHDCPPARLLAAEQVLMDGLRMVDEWQVFADRVPSEDTVFQRIGSFESQRRQLPSGSRIERDAERLYLLVDGRLSARRMIDLSRLGTFEGTRALARLCDLALIEPLAPSRASRAGSVRAPMLPGSPVRLLLATILPLLLLASLTLIPGVPSAPAAGPLQIEPDWAEQARGAFQTRRLRRALEARRLLTGTWPRELRQLADDGWLPETALTGPEAPPYYYARHGDAYVLLAPNR